MKIVRAFRSDPKLRATFLKVFALVIVCVLGWSAFMAYWTPRIYSSTARIEAQKSIAKVNFAGIGQTNRSWDPYFLTTQFRIITSWQILSKVITNLNLTHVLAAQAAESDWSVDKTFVELSRRINVASTRGSNLIEISVRTASPNDAANIANAIVGAYREFEAASWKKDLDLMNRSYTNSLHALPPPSSLATIPSKTITVRDPARPNLHSGLHNEWEAFKTSVIRGTLLALAAGAVSAWIAFVIRRSNRQQGAPP